MCFRSCPAFRFPIFVCVCMTVPNFIAMYYRLCFNAVILTYTLYRLVTVHTTVFPNAGRYRCTAELYEHTHFTSHRFSRLSEMLSCEKNLRPTDHLLDIIRIALNSLRTVTTSVCYPESSHILLAARVWPYNLLGGSMHVPCPSSLDCTCIVPSLTRALSYMLYTSTCQIYYVQVRARAPVRLIMINITISYG